MHFDWTDSIYSGLCLDFIQINMCASLRNAQNMQPHTRDLNTEWLLWSSTRYLLNYSQAKLCVCVTTAGASRSIKVVPALKKLTEEVWSKISSSGSRVDDPQRILTKQSFYIQRTPRQSPRKHSCSVGQFVLSCAHNNKPYGRLLIHWSSWKYYNLTAALMGERLSEDFEFFFLYFVGLSFTSTKIKLWNQLKLWNTLIFLFHEVTK